MCLFRFVFCVDLLCFNWLLVSGVTGWFVGLSVGCLVAVWLLLFCVLLVVCCCYWLFGWRELLGVCKFVTCRLLAGSFLCWFGLGLVFTVAIMVGWVCWFICCLLCC